MSLSLVHPAYDAPAETASPGEGTVVSLVSLMERLSVELGDLAAATDRMHVLVDRAPGACRDADYVRSAQGIDRSQQILAALAAFLAGVSREVDATVQVDLQNCLERVPLADLKRRLLPDSAPTRPTAQAGEIELF